MLISLAFLASAADAPADDHLVGIDALTADEIHAHGCGTMALYAKNGRPERKPLPKIEGNAADLQDRDPFGMPNVTRSEHFAFRWGNRKVIDPDTVQTILAALERAYDFQIAGMDHELPEEMDGYYMNVYLADSHTNAPRESDSASAYVTSDRDGYSYIAFMERTLADPDDLEAATSTAAHEFYHVVQFHTERYIYTDRDGWTPSAWFWEATANWAAGVTYPGQSDYARSLDTYAFYPHRRVDFFRHPSRGGYETGYQYGAFLWPLHASQQAKDFQVVADVWKDQGTNPDPNEVLRQKLADAGLDMDEVWLEHIARNVTWDYPDRAIYAEVIQENQGQTAASNLIAIELNRGGTDGLVSPPDDLIPERYGSNTLLMSRPNEGTYTFEIDGDAQSTAGKPAKFGATLVLKPYQGDVEYRKIPFEGSQGELVVDDLGEMFQVYVTIGAWTPESSDIVVDEKFPYQVQVSYDGPANNDTGGPGPTGEAPRPTQPSACHSAATPVGLGLFFGLAGLLGLARRRRD